MAGGRPTVMTPEVMRKLDEAFSWGCTDAEACLFAGISARSLYEYQTLHPEFAERKDTLKHHPTLKARRNLAKQLDEEDKQASQWYLERKKKDEFSLRTEQTGKDGAAIEIKTDLSATDSEIIQRYLSQKGAKTNE